MHRLGVEGLQRFTARRGVVLRRPKAEQLHRAAAKGAATAAGRKRACRAAVLTADLELLKAMRAQIAESEQRLAVVLRDTPAGVLSSLSGIGVVRASNYGAALGDPARFADAEHAYRASGLVPASYESAERARRGQGISRGGNVELSNAIIELGRALAQRDPDFARYRATVANRRKPLQAAIAVGHRAHRLAFALMRHGEPLRPGSARSSRRDRRRKENQEDGWARHLDQPRGGLPGPRDPPVGDHRPRATTTRKPPVCP